MSKKNNQVVAVTPPAVEVKQQEPAKDAPQVEVVAEENALEMLPPRHLNGFRFHPDAWTKLLRTRDYQPVEIAFFCILDLEDPTFILDIVLPKQTCRRGSVDIDHEWVATVMAPAMEKAGYKDWQWQSAWVHTHPGYSAEPSSVDIETHDEWYPNNPFTAMLIVGRPSVKGGTFDTCVRVRMTTRMPNGRLVCGTFRASLLKDEDAGMTPEWEDEFRRMVTLPSDRPAGQQSIEVAPQEGPTGGFLGQGGSGWMRDENGKWVRSDSPAAQTSTTPTAVERGESTVVGKMAVWLPSVPDNAAPEAKSLCAIARALYNAALRNDSTSYRKVYDTKYKPLNDIDKGYVDALVRSAHTRNGYNSLKYGVMATGLE